MNRHIPQAGLFLLLLSACTSPTPEPVMTPTPKASVTSTRVPATPTLSPTPTPTPVTSTLRVKDKLVNCRFGPGLVYAQVNELPLDETARVIGRNETSTWWYIRDPGNPNGTCWVSADVTEIAGDGEKLPVKEAPFVTVTDVSLRIEPTRIFVACDKFPQTVFLEAILTANGPTYVTWKWEMSAEETPSDGTIAFEESGKLLIHAYYQIEGPNEYWVNLHILTPNEIVKQVTFPVNCSP